MTKRKREYLAYLESGHWKKLRTAAFRRDHYKCCLCGSTKKLRGHHVRYRKNLRECKAKDILTLCQDCHDEYHREQGKVRRINRVLRKDNVRWVILNFSASDRIKVLEII